jgi:hypothetical protein
MATRGIGGALGVDNLVDVGGDMEFSKYVLFFFSGAAVALLIIVEPPFWLWYVAWPLWEHFRTGWEIFCED